MKTINRRSKKTINPILSAALYISRYHDDGQDAISRGMDADELIAMADRYRSVTLDSDGTLQVTINQCHFYTAYPSREVMKARMTDIAYARVIAQLDGTPAPVQKPVVLKAGVVKLGLSESAHTLRVIH